MYRRFSSQPDQRAPPHPHLHASHRPTAVGAAAATPTPSALRRGTTGGETVPLVGPWNPWENLAIPGLWHMVCEKKYSLENRRTKIGDFPLLCLVTTGYEGFMDPLVASKLPCGQSGKHT